MKNTQPIPNLGMHKDSGGEERRVIPIQDDEWSTLRDANSRANLPISTYPVGHPTIRILN